MTHEKELREASEVDLIPAQTRVIMALVGGATVGAAAATVGTSRTTLYRWLDDPKFVAVLNRAKREQRDEVRGEIRTLAAGAIKTLREALESDQTATSLRVKVALGVLKAIGVDEPEAIGSCRAEGVKQEWVYQDQVESLRALELKPQN
jgi:hypothetical protein